MFWNNNTFAHIDNCPPKVGIVILNYNNWTDTLECLESIFRSEYQNYFVTVIDNGSDNNSVDMILSWAQGKYNSLIMHNNLIRDIIKKPIKKPIRFIYYDIDKINDILFINNFEESLNKQLPGNHEDKYKLFIIKNNKNLGYAGGNNIGIKFSIINKADYVIIFNNDTIIPPDTIKKLVEVSIRFNIEIVGGLIMGTDGNIEFSGDKYPRMLFLSPRNRKITGKEFILSDRVEGSGALFSRNLLLKLLYERGYFLDESLFLYCEELELSLWCRRNKNVKTGIAINGVVYHKRGASLGAEKKSLPMFFITRNTIIIIFRYFKGLIRNLILITYIIISGLKVVKYAINSNFKMVKAILSGIYYGLKFKI